MALRDAIATLQSMASALPGMKEAPIDPPESANQFPFAVSYVRDFTWHIEAASFSHAFVTFITEIHCARGMTSSDIQIALPYFEQFLKKIMDDQTLGGTVANTGHVSGAFGAMSYAGQPTLGWQFVFDGPDGEGAKMQILASVLEMGGFDLGFDVGFD